MVYNELFGVSLTDGRSRRQEVHRALSTVKRFTAVRVILKIRLSQAKDMLRALDWTPLRFFMYERWADLKFCIMNLTNEEGKKR